MKYVLSILVAVVLFSCELAGDIKDLHKDLTTYQLGTTTMAPRNELGTVYDLDYKNNNPKRFDIIKFRFADEYFDENDFYSSDQHFSRVIGMPHETIEIKGGLVFINDSLLKQPFLVDSCVSNENFPRTQIKGNHYFVMVDHRKLVYNDSLIGPLDKPYDSRKINPIHDSKIIGVTNLK